MEKKIKGFTLIESMITLFIFCLIFLIPSFKLDNMQSELELNNTRRQVQVLIDKYARRSIIEDKNYLISHYSENNQITVNGKKQDLKINPDIKITNLNRLWISEKESIAPRTIKISNNRGSKKIKVQMKWGRMIND